MDNYIKGGGVQNYCNVMHIMKACLDGGILSIIRELRDNHNCLH